MGKGVFDGDLVAKVVEGLGITDLAKATIGEAKLIALKLEELTGIPFVRMDQGVPGLDPCEIGMAAEKEALDRGVAAIYPPAEGVQELKDAASQFIKAFMDVEVSPAACLPVCGSVAGSFGAFILCSQLDPKKDTILFIDPGFPIQKSQLTILGVKHEQFDIYAFRGEALRDKLESYMSKGNIAAIIYSNPNNPAWICLEESELKIIGEAATRHEAIVIEDLAYFSMDFRKPLGKPFKAPFQATVARYTDNYILMISGSKMFSYAGQRVAITAVSDKLFGRSYPALARRYGGTGHVGNTYTNAIMYMITSGVAHSVQYGLAAMMKASVEGRLDFVALTSEYARRTERMKRIFLDNGFYVVYDRDVEQPTGDGFFFTVGYPGMNSGELMKRLIHYGISSITLNTTGSVQDGIRACCSRMNDEKSFEILEQRLKQFRDDME